MGEFEIVDYTRSYEPVYGLYMPNMSITRVIGDYNGF
jgi:hypothetical protein